MSHREPVLRTVPIAELRVTRTTAGDREVAEKRRPWQEHTKQDGAEFLGRHMMPVLLGRKNRDYVIDHHHLARSAEAMT